MRGRRSGSAPKKSTLQSTGFASRSPSEHNGSSSIGDSGRTSSNKSGQQSRNRRSKRVTTTSDNNAGSRSSRRNNNRVTSTFKMRVSKNEAASFLKHKMLPLVPRIGSSSCKKRCGSNPAKRLQGSSEGNTSRRDRGERGGGDSTTYFSDGSEESGSSCGSSGHYFSSGKESDASYCSHHGKNQEEDYYSSGAGGSDSEEGSHPSDDGRSRRSGAASSCSSSDGSARSRDASVRSRGGASSARRAAGEVPLPGLRHRHIVVSRPFARSSRAEELRRDRRRAGRREVARTAPRDDREGEEDRDTEAEEGGEGRRRARQRMARLDRENDRLRACLAALRGDFEALLRRMGSVEARRLDEEAERSMASDDDGGTVSQSIERMRDIREMVLEKMEGDVEKKEKRGGTEERTRHFPLTSRSEIARELTLEEEVERETAYRDCIDDLLCENEQLCKSQGACFIVDLRELCLANGIPKRLCSCLLRGKWKEQNCLVPRALSRPSLFHSENTAGKTHYLFSHTTRSSFNICHATLTDHKIELLQGAQAVRSSTLNHTNTKKDGCASLVLDQEMSTSGDTVRDIDGVESDKQKKETQANAIDKEIIELMSKVLSHQQGVAGVASDNDENSQNQKEGQTKQLLQQQKHDQEEKENTKQEEEEKEAKFITGTVDDKTANNLELSLCTVLSKSGYENNGQRSCTNSEHSWTVVVENSNGVSSNSLFDGTSPSLFDGTYASTAGSAGQVVDAGNDGDEANLEIIHEYHSDSDSEGGIGPIQTAFTSSSTYLDQYADDDFDARSYSETGQNEGARYCHNDFYPSFLSEDEMIESTPGGYLYSCSGSATRSVYLSKAALHHHQHQYSKSISSEFPSDASKSGKVIEGNIEQMNYGASDLELEDDKLHVADNPREPGRIKEHGHKSHLDMAPALRHFASTPITCTASVASTSFSDNTPVFLSSHASTKERQGIGITVVSRSSHHESFPSSSAHTYETFFRFSLLKSQVDAILAEQLQETEEALERLTVTEINKAKRKRNKYQGEFNAVGKYHGYGIYISKNGNEYRGEWRNGKREGEHMTNRQDSFTQLQNHSDLIVVLCLPLTFLWYFEHSSGLGVVKIGNGDIFEGQFENNLKNGLGAYHFVDGECDLSLYRDDVRVGDNLRYSRDRQKIFLLSEDFGHKMISLEEASHVAQRMGAQTY